jgi:hypothetical protein
LDFFQQDARFAEVGDKQTRQTKQRKEFFQANRNSDKPQTHAHPEKQKPKEKETDGHAGQRQEKGGYELRMLLGFHTMPQNFLDARDE